MPRTSRGIKNPRDAALFLISRAQRPIILEVESALGKTAQVAQEYSTWTGENTTWTSCARTGFALNVGSGKWGSEYRIYFVKDVTVKNQLEGYGYRVDNGDVRYKGTFRVNSKSLFQELVKRHGLRLGKNM